MQFLGSTWKKTIRNKQNYQKNSKSHKQFAGDSIQCSMKTIKYLQCFLCSVYHTEMQKDNFFTQARFDPK